MTTASMTPEEIAAELKELFTPEDTEAQNNGQTENANGEQNR